jgi:hypothetical protein
MEVVPDIASLRITEVRDGQVYGEVWKSIPEIHFFARTAEDIDSMIGSWQNPAVLEGSRDFSPFTFPIPDGIDDERHRFLVAENGIDKVVKRLFYPQVWVSSLYINHIMTENALQTIWPTGAGYAAGIKPWDGKVSYVSVTDLRQWGESMRKRNMKIAYEKGRWPLPPDLYEMKVQQELQALRDKGDTRNETVLRQLIEEDIIEDRGEMLSTDDYEWLYNERSEFVRKAAAPELGRLRKIRDAGMLDLFESIELDGSIIKNVFPYTTSMMQWKLPVPEEDRFKPGFSTAEKFLDVLSDIVVYIRDQLGAEGQHIQFRILCNFHFWTYGEPVVPEQQADGTWIYHNVSFHRFGEHTLDFQHVVEYIREKPTLFAGVTTDFPLELYRQPAAKARYGRMAADLKKYDVSLRPIVTAMSAKDQSMEVYHQDILAFFDLLEMEVRPDMYMIQSWGTHPTVSEVKESEQIPGAWLNAVKRIIEKIYN